VAVDFEDLRTFTNVAKCGRVNAAARQIANFKSVGRRWNYGLETRLGSSLVKRINGLRMAEGAPLMIESDFSRALSEGGKIG